MRSIKHADPVIALSLFFRRYTVDSASDGEISCRGRGDNKDGNYMASASVTLRMLRRGPLQAADAAHAAPSTTLRRYRHES